MFVALGVGVPDSAIFHLYTHAFFKALLFLCAGSVMHAMGGIIDLREFSGLRRILPWTYRLTLVGCLALAGFPLLAGFWSKDEIVHACFNYHWAVGAIMLITAAMTAYYTFRMFFLCFHGPTRLPEEAGEHPHESPPVMIRPLVVLAIGAIFAGYAEYGGFGGSLSESFLYIKPHGFFHHYLHDSTLRYVAHEAGSSILMYISAAIAIIGILLAWARYGEAPVEDPDQRALGDTWNLWHAKYYVDEIYDYAFVWPLRRMGNFFFATDNNGIDGLIWLVTAIPRGAGAGLRFLQQGALQGYALGMAIGMVVLLLLWRWMDTAMAG
jgi:NADH-quinone oxidoreductase subunit L